MKPPLIENPFNTFILMHTTPIHHDGGRVDGLVYNSALKSYTKYRDGESIATFDVPLNINGNVKGFNYRDLVSIGLHMEKIQYAMQQFTVYRHNKTGNLYVILHCGRIQDGDTGEAIIEYMSLENNKVYTHKYHDFITKKNEDGKLRFEATGDVWSGGNIMKKPEYVGK